MSQVRRAGSARNAVPWLSLICTIPLSGAIALLPDEVRHLTWPVAVAFIIAAAVIEIIWKSEGVLPLFDAGTLAIGACLLYILFPPLGYIAGGLAYTILSDGRLLEYAPTAEDVADISWRYVAYLVSFAVAYVALRRTTKRIPGTSVNFTPNDIVVLLLLSGSLTFYLIALQIASGFSFASSYTELAETTLRWETLPTVVKQLTHNAVGILFLAKLGLLIALFHSWRLGWARALIILWLGSEVLSTVWRLGDRGDVTLLLMAGVLLYHQYVKRLSATATAVVMGSIIMGFISIGVVRDYWTTRDLDYAVEALSISNEFQAHFASTFDIVRRFESGRLEIPWQIHASDLLRLIPQQILPIQKIEPTDWYTSILGLEGTGLAFPFGAVATGVVAGGWPAIALYGVIAGALIAAAQRFWLRNAGSPYRTLFYLWACINSYYVIRGSALYPVVWVIYRVLPFFMLLYFGSAILRLLARNQRTPKASSVA